VFEGGNKMEETMFVLMSDKNSQLRLYENPVFCIGAMGFLIAIAAMTLH
jgi:hypothetical protein